MFSSQTWHCKQSLITKLNQLELLGGDYKFTLSNNRWIFLSWFQGIKRQTFCRFVHFFCNTDGVWLAVCCHWAINILLSINFGDSPMSGVLTLLVGWVLFKLLETLHNLLRSWLLRGPHSDTRGSLGFFLEMHFSSRSDRYQPYKRGTFENNRAPNQSIFSICGTLRLHCYVRVFEYCWLKRWSLLPKWNNKKKYQSIKY